MDKPAATLMLIESKNAGGSSMVDALRKANYDVMVVYTGKDALQMAQQSPPDLVIFDASAMRSNGARSCRRLRNVLDSVPLIHCRAGGTEDPHANADIYLSHPFTPRKLLNRIRTLLPANELEEEVIRCGDIVLYKQKRSVDVAGQGEARLTPKLASLLEEFIRHPYVLISRRQLMLNVWKTEYVGDTRTLDVHIRWIREHIESDPAQPECLRTIRGEGYVFEMPMFRKTAVSPLNS